MGLVEVWRGGGREGAGGGRGDVVGGGMGVGLGERRVRSVRRVTGNGHQRCVYAPTPNPHLTSSPSFSFRSFLRRTNGLRPDANHELPPTGRALHAENGDGVRRVRESGVGGEDLGL